MKNKKIEIKIHYSLYIMFVLSLFISKINNILIYTIIIFFHEMFHLFSSMVFGLRPKKIELTIIGGFIDIPLNNLSLIKRFIVAISGILFNILLIIFLLYKGYGINNVIIQYNFLLIAFSLLPIYPLDGYNIIFSLIEIFIKNNKTIKICNYISVLFLLIYIIISIYSKSIALIIMSIFLINANIKFIKNYDLVYLKSVTFSN